MYVWYANDIHVYIVDSKIGCENVIVLIFRWGGGGSDYRYMYFFCVNARYFKSVVVAFLSQMGTNRNI